MENCQKAECDIL